MINKKVLTLSIGAVAVTVFIITIVLTDNKPNLELGQIDQSLQLYRDLSGNKGSPQKSQDISQKQPKNDNRKVYEGKHFSFRYPPNLKISRILNKSDEIITAEGNKFSFQIFIMPFGQPGPITPKRIWQDLPNTKINNPGKADLDGVETLIFYGYNAEIGNTFEVWMTYRENLYQIMTGSDQEDLLIEILGTWIWK